MASYIKCNDFTEQLILGHHDFDVHTFKIALTDVLPLATQPSFDPLVHLPPVAGNGYPAGGIITTVSLAEALGVSTLKGTAVTFTATAGGIGPFRYAILYNDSMVAPQPVDGIVAFWDYGQSITLNETETFTIRFNNENPGTIFTLA